MNTRIKQIFFWGRMCLEAIGTTAATALVMFVVMDVGISEYTQKGMKEMIAQLLPEFGGYIAGVGLFMVIVWTIQYFSLGFSALLSMNATRKSIVCGIMCSLTGIMLALQGFSGIIWKIFPGETSSRGLKILPFLSGGMFALTALFAVGSIVVIKWGQMGGIIMAVMCVLLGGCAGAGFILLGEKDAWFLQEANLESIPVDAGLFMIMGIGLFVCVWILALIATRKTEVRR